MINIFVKHNQRVMKSYRIKSFGSIAGIVVQTETDPTPKPGEVLVKLMAASLNRRDLTILNRTYPLPATPDVIPLSDGVGVVVALGAGVTKFKTGDRVSANYFPKWRSGKFDIDVLDQFGCTIDGMLSEYACLHEDYLVRVPDYLSWEEASTLPCAGLTAWCALKTVAPSNTILTMGTGGVSLFAIQFAKLRGAKVIALTSRSEKIDTLYSLGADNVLNSRQHPEWSSPVIDLTGGKGVDLVVETGGSETLERSIKACRIGAEIILLTPSVEKTIDIDLNELTHALFVRLITLKTHYVGSRIDFEEMNQALINNKLLPVIAKTFSFDEVHEAYSYFAKSDHAGKVVITFN
jgi:NADPH:quinone reductase-like Zn-dependent oxidoreductase